MPWSELSFLVIMSFSVSVLAVPTTQHMDGSGCPSLSVKAGSWTSPGEERDVAVISALKIRIIIFTSLNPFSVCLNASSF